MTLYGREHAPHTKAPERIGRAFDPLLKWWGDKTLDDVGAVTCRAYAAWRGKIVARYELEILRAAINYCAAEHKTPVVKMKMPEKPAPRQRWLTRSEAARLLWAAWRGEKSKHLARFILIGLYTGTRRDAILALRWHPHHDGGWVDLERGVLHRRADGSIETNKRRPASRLSRRLRPHLERWRRLDGPLAPIVHFRGRPITWIEKTWIRVRTRAGLGDDVVPHSLRHSATTWLLQRGVDVWEVAGFVGMSAKVVQTVYGHHSPHHQRNAAEAF